MRTLSAFLTAALIAAGAAAAEGKYQPTWPSLTKHPVPKWFRDAKFGIYFHWGVYSVPAYDNEWYSRNMYRQGSRAYKHHVAKYGHPGKFGYKDFLPMFKAEKFDAEKWADLFQKAGARFAGPVGEHADGFAMWASDLTKWDVGDMGPKRDITAEIAQAVRKRGMKLVVTFHHGWNWGWYPTCDKRYDCSNPAWAGLYGFPFPKGANARKVTDRKFYDEWRAKVFEVIGKYQPDFLWFDSKLGIIDEKVRQTFLAHYYNKAIEWGREVGVSYKRKDLPPGAGILDIERGRMGELTDFTWLTDTSVCRRSWCDVRNPAYMSADRLVDTLIDIVSKNGVLLLNIPPRADGTIPQPVIQRLLEMGKWLKVNGEAVYGTRPWKVYGCGPTKVAGGMFGDKKIGDFTAADIRFTRNGDVVYAVALAWPGKQLSVKPLGTDAAALLKGSIADVRLLGHTGKLKWTRTKSALTIDLPDAKPCQYAFVFKVEQGT